MSIHAVCDINEEGLAASKEALGAKEAYLDHDEMLEKSDLDAVLIGSIDGESGIDTLQGDLIDAVILTGTNGAGLGFNGTETSINGGFYEIENITGNGGTLTGRNISSTWSLAASPTYNDGTNTLGIIGFGRIGQALAAEMDAADTVVFDDVAAHFGAAVGDPDI